MAQFSVNNNDAGSVTETEKGHAKKKIAGKWLGIAIFVLVAVIWGSCIYNMPVNRLSRYLNLGNKYLEEQNYEQAIVEFDKAIQIDPMNADAYLGMAKVYEDLGDMEMATHILEDSLSLTGNEKIKEQLIKYQDKLKTVELQEIHTEVEDVEENRAEMASFMQKIYDLMEAEDWEALRILNDGEGMASFLEQMGNDRYLYFPDKNVKKSGTGVGVYKYGSNHYFYYGDYVSSIRSGEGIYYEANDYGAFDYFSGEWKDDAPNGQGKLTENYRLSDELADFRIVVEGNYINGLSDGHMNCVLTDPENGDFDLSYTAVYGTPEDITDMVHQKDPLSWRDNYIYAYDEIEDETSWNLHLNSKDDKLGVFGFQVLHEISWKDAYVGYINDKKYNSYYNNADSYLYRLVNVNNDDIPELYIDYGTTAEGSVLCSFYNGAVIEQPLWSFGLSYIEGENLFMDSGGHMDSYYDYIYCIRNGEFFLLDKGEVGAFDNTNVQYDSEGNPIYDYFWNGVHLSGKEAYFNMLNEVYDTQKAVSVNEEFDMETWNRTRNGFFGYEEIIENINNY